MTTDADSLHQVRAIAKFLGLVYVDLPLLLSYEKSDPAREFAHRCSLEVAEVLYILKRYTSRQKSKINGFCFNLDFLCDAVNLTRISYLKIPGTHVDANASSCT